MVGAHGRVAADAADDRDDDRGRGYGLLLNARDAERRATMVRQRDVMWWLEICRLDDGTTPHVRSSTSTSWLVEGEGEQGKGINWLVGWLEWEGEWGGWDQVLG